MFDCINYRIDGTVAIIQIDQLQDENRMNRKTYLETTEALRRAQDDEHITAVIITGKGKYFVTGGRMDGYPGGKTMEMRGFADACAGLMFQIFNMRKPMIAAVNGLCIQIDSKNSGFITCNANANLNCDSLSSICITN